METNEAAIMRAREVFRIIANRGAVCFDTTQYMREIDPLYQFSFEQFLELYNTAISHSDRWVFVMPCIGNFYNYRLSDGRRFPFFSLFFCPVTNSTISVHIKSATQFILSVKIVYAIPIGFHNKLATINDKVTMNILLLLVFPILCAEESF